MAPHWIAKCFHCGWVESGETYAGVSARAAAHEAEHATAPRHLVTIALNPRRSLAG
jgi:hypothetical protein